MHPPSVLDRRAPLYGYLSKEYVRSGDGRRKRGDGGESGWRGGDTERGRSAAGVLRVAAAIPADDQRPGLGGARFEDAAGNSEWIRRTAAEREAGNVEWAAAGSAARH